MNDFPSVVELRQYTLRPGQRDVLIELFEREFIEAQEAAGMRVLGQFRDLDRPDRFVWLRGFSDLRTRAESLRAFYGGPVWKAHRERANATMVDSDNVLMLRPVRPWRSGFALPRGALYVATIYLLRRAVDEAFVRFFNERIGPVMVETGAPPVAMYETEPAENAFPALPVRDEHAFVWFAAFESEGAYGEHLERLRLSEAWNEPDLDLSALLKSPAERIALQPTARSLFGSPTPR